MRNRDEGSRSDELERFDSLSVQCSDGTRRLMKEKEYSVDYRIIMWRRTLLHKLSINSKSIMFQPGKA